MSTAARIAPADACTADASRARGGRPMDAARDGAILDAVLELIAEVGYDRMSIESVAARAQASKATVYRRWSDKADLVAAAVARLAQRSLACPDTGALRTDLIEALRLLGGDSPCSDLPVMCGVLTAAARDRRLAAVLTETVAPVKRRAAHACFERAVRRGELPASADEQVFHEIGPAMVLSRVMLTGDRVDDAFLEHVVDDVLLPLLLRER